jgi:imidazolonepropionase-like amidohydrolase
MPCSQLINRGKIMKRILVGVFLLGTGILMISLPAVAQNLVITNARIIVGNGELIEQGSLVIRDGKIFSVNSENAIAVDGDLIDAAGMTIMPGFIDAHRHFPTGGDDISIRMQEFLDAGYTTLLHGGGQLPDIIDFKSRVESGEFNAPRILTSGRVNTAGNTPENARREVQLMVDAGVQFIKSSIPNAPSLMDIETLTSITDQARLLGIPTMIHAVTVPAMNVAVEAGVDKLVHTPHDSWLSPEDARKVAQAGIETLSTIGFAVPVFGVFNEDNIPTFREGSSWPDNILGTGANAAGEKPVNGRTLWDSGVTYGFGTDTGYHPWEGLKHELSTLNLMFSELDIIRLMGPNTAAFINMSDELGSLEPGKLADIVIIDGDPLEGYWNLLNVQVTILEGRIVSDKR